MFGTTGSVILKAMADNLAKGGKKPLCYGVAYKDGGGEQLVLDTLVFWTRKGAGLCCRELKKATGVRFYPVAFCHRKRSKTAG